MKRAKDVNAFRSGVLLAVMLFGAAAGSMLASEGLGKGIFLPVPSFENALIFDMIFLAVIFSSAYFSGGSFIILLISGLKCLFLSGAATVFLKDYGIRRYIMALPMFSGNALSLLGFFLLSLRAVDLSAAKRYNKNVTDKSYYAAAFLCVAFCAAGDFLISLRRLL